jgi:hypothetical protein
LHSHRALAPVGVKTLSFHYLEGKGLYPNRGKASSDVIIPSIGEGGNRTLIKARASIAPIGAFALRSEEGTTLKI